MTLLKFVLDIFFFVWFIAGKYSTCTCSKIVYVELFNTMLLTFVGNFWIFGIYNDFDESNESSGLFCDPTLYWFAFWSILATYILVLFTVGVSFCWVSRLRMKRDSDPTVDLTTNTFKPNDGQ